jgi:hypothetical protein
MITIAGVQMSEQAAECIQSVAGTTKAALAAEITADVERLARGESSEALLAHCLDGAEPEYVQGWSEYVEAIAAAAVR